jgi:hypothetical protein
MSEFKVGDRVRVKRCTFHDRFMSCDGHNAIGKTGVISEVDRGEADPYSIEGIDNIWRDADLELVKEGDTPMGRRTFKLLKATPTHKAGTLFMEDCEDGTQPYSTFELEGTSDYMKITDRSKVEDAPKWFVEVFKVEPEYMTKDELDAFKKFKAKKPVTTAAKTRRKPSKAGKNAKG